MEIGQMIKLISFTFFLFNKIISHLKFPTFSHFTNIGYINSKVTLHMIEYGIAPSSYTKDRQQSADLPSGSYNGRLPLNTFYIIN